MKKYIIICFLIISQVVYSQVSTIEKIVEFDWNTADGLKFENSFDGNYSFSSFQIIDNKQIAFLSNMERKIKVFDLKTGKFVSEFVTTSVPYDFAYNNRKFYVQTNNSILIFNFDGILVKQINYPKTIYDIERIQLIDNDLYILIPNGKSILIAKNDEAIENVEYKGWIFMPDTFCNVVKMSDYAFQIEILNSNGILLQKQFPVADIHLLSVKPTQFEKNLLYIDIEYFNESEPLKIHRKIWCIDTKSTSAVNSVTIYLPDIYFTSQKHDIVIENNQYFHIVSAPEKCYVMKHIFDAENKISELKYPSYLLDRQYHYNDFTPKQNDIEIRDSIKKNDNSQVEISREQILANADIYLNYNWLADSTNIKNYDCGGKQVVTPQWVQSGNNVAFPYMWGGFSSVSGFQNGIAAHKSAGDSNTSTGFGAPGCAEGHDCSGFVSRVWMLSQKYSTSSLPQISIAYQSYNQLLPGDIVNYASNHVRLVVVNNPNGTVDCIEATKGLSEWRVLRRNYSYTQIQNYIPRYYKYVTTNVLATPQNENDFTVCPNPASESVQIRFPHHSKTLLQILSIDGKILFQNIYLSNFSTNFETIDTRHLTSGIYLVVLKSENNIFTKKLIITK